MLYVSHIVRKELRQYIYSPIAYIVAGVFHGILGFFFLNSIVRYSQKIIDMSGSGVPGTAFTPTVIIMQGLLNSMGTVFLLLVPLITMRLLAEEKRGHTMELLMTSPVSLYAIVLGKFIAAFIVYSVIIIFTLYMPVILDIFSIVNWPHVVTGYCGVLLMGAAMISVGLFASSVTDKQVVAAVLCTAILILLWFVGGGIGSASQRATDFMREVSLYKPFADMISGLVDLRDVFFMASFSTVMLFLTHRVLESSRW